MTGQEPAIDWCMDLLEIIDGQIKAKRFEALTTWEAYRHAIGQTDENRNRVRAARELLFKQLIENDNSEYRKSDDNLPEFALIQQLNEAKSELEKRENWLASRFDAIARRMGTLRLRRIQIGQRPRSGDTG